MNFMTSLVNSQLYVDDNLYVSWGARINTLIINDNLWQVEGR